MTTILENVSDAMPLKLYDPSTLIVFLSFYSPIIIVASVIILSVVNQNFKGFIYLLYLIGSLLLREGIYLLFYNKQPNKLDFKMKTMGQTGTQFGENKICNSIQYSPYGNPTFSAFVFAFTITYLCSPMFFNGDPNFWIFFFLIVYFFLDIGIKIYKKCVIHMGDLFINVLFGGGMAIAIVLSMYAGNSSKFLYFVELSNKQFCSLPKKQQFKCSLYKNGELISGSV